MSSSFTSIAQLQCICLASRKSSAPAPHLAPLPKGAGLRQDSIVSNISIFSDTHNAPILQTISAVKTEGSPPDYLHFHKHRQIRTIPRPALSKIQIRAESATTIIHYSSFIIHYPSVPPMYHFHTTCYFHSRKLFSSHILLLYQP